MPSQDKLAEFVTWVKQHLTGDEKGEAQIFLDHLFQALGWTGGLKEAGATLEMRVPKADAGGTAFADLVWKPVVLIEMKKRGVNLQPHLSQAFRYWERLCPTARATSSSATSTSSGFTISTPTSTRPRTSWP